MAITSSRIVGTGSARLTRGRSACIQPGPGGRNETRQTRLGCGVSPSRMPSGSVRSTTQHNSRMEGLVWGDPAQLIEQAEEYAIREEQGCEVCVSQGKGGCTEGMVPGHRGFCPAWRLVDEVA